MLSCQQAKVALARAALMPHAGWLFALYRVLNPTPECASLAVLCLSPECTLLVRFGLIRFGRGCQPCQVRMGAVSYATLGGPASLLYVCSLCTYWWPCMPRQA